MNEEAVIRADNSIRVGQVDEDAWTAAAGDEGNLSSVKMIGNSAGYIRFLMMEVRVTASWMHENDF